MVRNARKVWTKCLRSRLTRSGDIGTTALSFLGIITGKLSFVQTLHRSDEALVTSEIEAAGFKLIDHGDFLHVPGDARDAHSHSSAQPVDSYMLKFRRPGWPAKSAAPLRIRPAPKREFT
jgi:hypothetical protein